MPNLHQYLALGALICASTARATASMEPDVVSGIEVRPSSEGGQVILRGTRAPVFSVYRLSDPDRIVVDLTGADVSKAVVPQGYSIPGVNGISTVQFQEGAVKVGRLVLNAAPTVSYDVTVVGNDVRVALLDPEPSGPADSINSKEPNRQELPSQAIAAVESTPVAAARPTVDVAKPGDGAKDDNLIERIEDTGPKGHRGVKILAAVAGVSSGQPTLRIETDGPIGDLTLLRLKDPSRIAVDLAGFKTASPKSTIGGEVVAIRFGRSGPKTARVVFDLKGEAVPKVSISRSKHGLTLGLLGAPGLVADGDKAGVSQAKVASTASTLAPDTKVALAAAAPVSTPKPSITLAVPARAQDPKQAAMPQILDVKVNGDSAEERVVIELPTAPSTDPQSTPVAGHGFELRLTGYRIPDSLRRTLDASSYGGPLATVSAFNVGTKGSSEGRIVVAAAPGTTQDLGIQGRHLNWRFWPERVPSPTTPPSIAARNDASSGQVASATTNGSSSNGEFSGRPRYTGRRISLEFKDIDMQNLLRLFADISHKNVVVSDDVKGKVTIALRNVPWDQAFALILKTHGLGMEESGNIIRVAPEAELEKERKEALDAQKARSLLEPLRVRLIPVNYALATEISDKVKDILSERGVVTVDGRTNVLIVKDVPENLAKAEGMVRNLDTQTPQVLIESRIVEAAVNYTKEIGIQWGGGGGFAPIYGNTTGLVFPSTALVAGAAGGQPNAGTAATPNFAVNLPAAIGPGSGGGLGFIFGSAGGAFQLNLRLSAAEANGTVKTVSAPKVATLDNQEADISQGVSIPFAQVSAAGVQTAFVEARLELKVTPHVTSDGAVLMKINATNNHPDPGITGANGQPAIDRKEAKTQMLVRDGDTVVIGGIYTRQTGVSVQQVPFFGDIPILGWLFKHRLDADQRSELLIFITPRVLNRQQVVTAGN
jgi:type IV pilus assembly protein PilQ